MGSASFAPADQGLVAVLREGSWRQVSRGWLPRVATAAVLADVLTTAYGLYSPAYVEIHRVLAWLAGISSSLSLAVLVGYCLVNLAVVWFSFGWFSPVVAVFLVAMMGLGGLNNAVLFATGTGIYPRLGVASAVTIHVVQPVAGLVLGLAVARLRGPLPWREVVLVLAPGIGVLSLPLWL